MKKILLPLCFLFAFVSVTNAEQISLVNPISEIELSDSSASSFVKVTLTLKEPENAAEAQVAIEDFNFIDCTAVDGTRRVTGPVFMSPNDKMHPVCTITIGATGNNVLRPDWSKFNLEVRYRFVKEGATSPITTFRGINSLSRCIKVSNVSANIIGTPLRTGEREITIPIKLNADIRLKPELKKPDGSIIARAKEENVLFENDAQKMVVMQVLGGFQFENAVLYEFSLAQLPSQPPTQIDIKGLKSFSLGNFNPYTMPKPNIIVKDDGSAQITFTTSPVSGSMKVFINGGKDSIYNDTNTVNRDFAISADKIPTGINTLTFSGESEENKLILSGSNTFQTFSKEGKTFLKETPVTFNYEESANMLKIKFALSKKINTRWQFKGQNGLGQNVPIVTSAENLYEASINLALLDNKNLIESKLIETASDPLKKAPVEIEIINADKPGEVVASFVVNFIKPKQQIIDKVKQAETLASNNKWKDAKKLIAEVLGFLPNTYDDNDEQKSLVESAALQLRKTSDTKSKVFKILGIAGKIAAGFVGIPLPF